MNKYGFDHRPAVHRASAEPAAVAKPTLLRALLLGTLVVVLIYVRYRFLWWPLHPLGLAISSVWMVRYIVFSFVLAWFCKWMVLQYGGVKLYREVRPFFVGLIFGFFIGVTVSFIVDLIWFPDAGHSIWG